MSTTLDQRPDDVGIAIIRGDQFDATLVATDSAGDPVDLSSAGATFDILEPGPLRTVVKTTTPAVSGAGNNILTLQLTETETGLLTENEYRWSVAGSLTAALRQWGSGSFEVDPVGSSRPSSTGSTLALQIDSDLTFTLTVGVTIPDTAVTVAVTDSGGYFTGTNLETVTQELGADVADIEANYAKYDVTPAMTNTAIQTVLDAAAAGSTVHWAPGTYTLTTRLDFDQADDVTWMGYGAVLVCDASHTQHMIWVVGVDRFAIKGFHIDMNKAATTDQASTTNQAGIFVNCDAGAGSVDFEIVDVTVVDGHQTGIFVDADVKSTTPSVGRIRGCTVLDCSHRGIRALRTQDVTVSECYVARVGNAGIHQEQVSGGSVTNCRITDPGGHGIIANGSQTVSGDNVVITGNRVSGATLTGIVAGKYALGFTITGNNVTGSTDNGISVDPQLAVADWTLVECHGVVSGNTTRGSGGHGIYCRVAEYVTITGNSVDGGTLHGIAVQNSRWVTVGNNTVKGNSRGITFAQNDAEGVQAGYIEVYGNSVTGNTSADIDVASAEDLTNPVYIQDGASRHGGMTLEDNVGFYGTAPLAQQTGVAVSAAAVHAALVALGLITA